MKNNNDNRWIMDGHVLTKESSKKFDRYLKRKVTQEEIDFMKKCEEFYLYTQRNKS